MLQRAPGAGFGTVDTIGKANGADRNAEWRRERPRLTQQAFTIALGLGRDHGNPRVGRRLEDLAHSILPVPQRHGTQTIRLNGHSEGQPVDRIMVFNESHNASFADEGLREIDQ